MLAAVQAKQGKDSTQAVTPAAEPVTPAVDGEKAAEETTTPADETQAGEPQDEYTFDEDGFTGARDLAAKIDAIEALKGAIPDDLRGEIMANARIAEAMAPYREIFGSPEEAKRVAAGAQEFAGIQQIFSSISGENVAQGTSDMINKMLELSALRDEDGNPRKRENGSYITDGTTTNFLNELYTRAFQTKFVRKIEAAIADEKAKNNGDSAIQAAFDMVMESAGLRPSTADKTSEDPVLAARKAELDQQQKAIDDQRKAAQQERVNAHTEARDAQYQAETDRAIESLLSHATGLNEFAKTTVVAKLTKALKAAIRSNTAYQMDKEHLDLQPIGTKRLNAEVKLAKDFLRNNLARIAKPILLEAGAVITKKQAGRAAAQAAREQAARSDISGSATQPQRVNSANPREAYNATRERLKQSLGREPSDSEINVEMMMNLPGIRSRAA